MLKFDPATIGFVICDMQNDFLHAEGAYARGGAMRLWRTRHGLPGRGLFRHISLWCP